MKKSRRPPEVCPVCDADVPLTAKACPACGACYKSGWNEDEVEGEEEIDYDLLDLPTDEDDHEERRVRESRNVKRLIPSKWRWVALILVVLWLIVFWFARGSWTPW